MLEVYCRVTNEKEKDGGTRGPVGSGRKGRERRGLRYELSVCLRFEPDGSVVMSYWTNESKETELEMNRSSCWRECIPFYR